MLSYREALKPRAASNKPVTSLYKIKQRCAGTHLFLIVVVCASLLYAVFVAWSSVEFF